MLGAGTSVVTKRYSLWPLIGKKIQRKNKEAGCLAESIFLILDIHTQTDEYIAYSLMTATELEFSFATFAEILMLYFY